jgi:hypothetical protein
LIFADYVASGRKANSISVRVRDPNGNVKATELGQVTFEQTPSGNYCLEAGGSHVKSYGSDQCFSITQSGTQTYRIIENASDVEKFWSSGDAGQYDPSQKRAIADSSVFNNSWLNTVKQGFALGAACVHGTPTSVTLGAIPPSGGPPAGSGYDIVIREGAPFTAGDEMLLPRQGQLNKLSAAGEEERVHGGYGDYGGFEQEINSCAYPLSYGSAAILAGAPRR